MVSSMASYTPTDLSRKTERTSVSLPADGRAITIHTNRRKATDDGNGSTLTAASQTSLLIEYFESGKRVDGVPTSRPSVRVKLTPSSGKGRSHVKSRDPTEVSARETDRTRRPSYNNRTSLPLPKGDDRFTLGEDRIDANGHSRSFSGDLSSNLSMEDDDSRAPIDVTIYRGESPSIHNSSGRYHEHPDITIRTKTGKSSSKKKYRDSYGDTLSPNVTKKGRSRSTSREYDDQSKHKLGRRRSRSLSQERISQKVKEKIEKLGAEVAMGKKAKNVDDNGNLKAPRRRRDRSTSRDRSEKKSEKLISDMVIGKITDNQQYDPALLEAVEDSIRKLILPKLHELKLNQNKSKFDQALAAISAKVQPHLAVANDPKGVKSASMPDVSKPAVVLQPDFDKGRGQGFLVSTPRDRSPNGNGARKHEENRAESLQSDSTYTQAPGLGPTLMADGHSIHSLHSDRGEGVLLEPTKDAARGQRLSMPLMPHDNYPESISGETRISIRTEQDALPYPADRDATAMPGAMNSPGRSRASSINSLDSFGGRKIIREPESELAPSTLYPEDLEDRPHSTSSIDSGSRISVHSIQHAFIAQAKPIVVNSPSQLSIPSISDTPSTKIARQRRKGKARHDSIGEAPEDDDKGYKEYAPTDLSNSTAAPPAKNSADWFAEQRELAQQKALLDPNLQRAAIEVRHMSAHDERSSEDMQSEQVRTGQEVYGISAFNPSLVSTPFAVESNVASIRDGMSNLSFQTLPALPGHHAFQDHHHEPMPDHRDHRGIAMDDDEDDEITNPSVIQGPIGHRNDNNWDDLAPANIGEGKHQVKDEGYASPGYSSPGPSAHPMGGIDDIMESDEYNSPHRGRHSRVGSGGSHGMPDQLYDSATGRGVERIQSKDIIALMDHVRIIYLFIVIFIYGDTYY